MRPQGAGASRALGGSGRRAPTHQRQNAQTAQQQRQARRQRNAVRRRCVVDDLPNLGVDCRAISFEAGNRNHEAGEGGVMAWIVSTLAAVTIVGWSTGTGGTPD